ncbi:MAG: HlyD family efflux transporter periplasmic adaptor subunit, partial [Planctomycetota bacterium]
MNSSRDPQPAGAGGVFFGQALTRRQFLTPRRRTPSGPIAFALAIGVLVGDTAVAQRSGPRSGMPVSVSPAEPVESFLRERVYTGTLVARRRSTLSFERAGKVVELLADEGARVSAGQLLARLDTRRLDARRAQAVADLSEGNAVLRELVAGPRQETIAAATAEVRNLAAQRDVVARNLQRRERLVPTGAITREEYDETVFELRAADARVDVAQKKLDELLAGTRVEQVAAQRARVGAIEARVADINHELEDSTLVAPYAGRVARRQVDEGAVVGAGERVFEIVEDDALEAWIGVPPTSAGRLQVGEPIRVTIAGTER